MAIGAAPDGDPYLLPSLMVSLVLHDSGFDDTNSGPATPIDVLANAVEDEKSRIIWLALTNPIRSRIQDREMSRLSNAVAACPGTFFIGGKSVDSYGGEGAVRCGTMMELGDRAIAVMNRTALP